MSDPLFSDVQLMNFIAEKDPDWAPVPVLAEELGEEAADVEERCLRLVREGRLAETEIYARDPGVWFFAYRLSTAEARMRKR